MAATQFCTPDTFTTLEAGGEVSPNEILDRQEQLVSKTDQLQVLITLLPHPTPTSGLLPPKLEGGGVASAGRSSKRSPRKMTRPGTGTLEQATCV